MWMSNAAVGPFLISSHTLLYLEFSGVFISSFLIFLEISNIFLEKWRPYLIIFT